MIYKWIPKIGCMFWIERQNSQKIEIPHNIFSDLVLYGKDELLGSQPLCNLGSPEKHVLTSHRRDQSQPAIKLDATLGCHTEISKSFGSGYIFPAASSGMRLKIRYQRNLSREKIPFRFIFPDFIAAKWRWNLQKTQIFGMFVAKVQWTAVYLESLWTISNHKCAITTGKPTSPVLKLPGAWKARYFIVVACPWKTQVVSLQL